MKFTLSWLKDHLDTDAPLADILAALTRLGLEVEGVVNPGAALADFRVARVLTADPHPNADKLRLLTVDAGSDLNDGRPWQVVCGAPNARAGMIGVFGPPGAYVPGAGFTLKPATIRDVESFGMMCSTRELELGEDHDGIIELPADAPVGAAYPGYAGLDDPVIDVAVTPNRQDCMGVRGIARDLAAAGIGMLKPLAIPVIADASPAPDVRVKDAEGCPAFFARTVAGVRNGTSPDWMQRRLKAVGQRAISALVDITNYVMLDLGRPLHVYDRAKLSGGLVARQACVGETLLALNGKSYTLQPGMTVIADDRQVHDIGGIMGGEDAGASDTTTDVLIECAYFTPEGIARTGQALGLTSDARTRFERGVDPGFLDDGLSLATQLVIDLCGGTPSAATRAGTPPTEQRTILFDTQHTQRIAGIIVPPERQAEILRALGFDVTGDDPFAVVVPSWRRDVSGPADLVEEVVRVTGLDQVDAAALPRTFAVARPTATPVQLLERRLRRAAAAAGFHEAVTWSFIAPADAAAVGGGDWTLANPISEELKVMRPSLLPGLLRATQRNLDRGQPGVRLFELGRRYFRAQSGSSDERATLALALAGASGLRDWQAGRTAVSPFDVKGVVETLLEAAGVAIDKLQVMDVADPAAIWHPGQSATLRLGPKTVLAEFGALHPRLLRAFDVTGPVVAAQIFLDAIPARRARGTSRDAFAPSSLQPVTRDFAFLVDDALVAADLIRAIRAVDKQAIVDARVFDRFVKDGQTSLAVEITLQPGEQSFTEDALKAIGGRIVAAAATLGATLRG